MKKVTLFITLFFTAFCFSQNQSFGSVQSSIFTPIPQQFSGGEIFRFRPGLVTQLDSGTDFGFTSSRWFSIGRLNTGSQTVFGLRFQLPNRALTMGYQDLNDANPRLQWIGDSTFSGTDFEFRVANSFTSTSSTLVATMTNDGKTYFGTPLTTNETKVGINYGDVGSTRAGLTLENVSTVNAYLATGIKSINSAGGYRKIGVDIQGTSTAGAVYENTGVNIRLNGGYLNSGVTAIVTGSDNGTTYGVYGSISGTGTTTPTGFGAGIYGRASTNPNRYAGYFNGNVFTTGLYLSSDKKLKQSIKNEENVLEKLAQLDAVTYTFKPNEQLNLPKGLQHGFLAQNLEEVFPELVSTIKKPIFDKENKEVDVYEYKSVNYIGMISVLTSSIKELNAQSTARINELEAQSAASINELNEKIAALENRLENITGEATSSGTKLGGQNTAGNVGFSMEQNKPNPFTNQTVVNYTLPSNTKATIAVVDLSGKFIREYNLSTEKGQLIINSSDIGKGIFIYTLISDNEVIISKKMIVR